jgi:hypothetical protein
MNFTMDNCWCCSEFFYFLIQVDADMQWIGQNLMEERIILIFIFYVLFKPSRVETICTLKLYLMLDYNYMTIKIFMFLS